MRHHVSLDVASSIANEMLLLHRCALLRDACWEYRVRPGTVLLLFLEEDGNRRFARLSFILQLWRCFSKQFRRAVTALSFVSTLFCLVCGLLRICVFSQLRFLLLFRTTSNHLLLRKPQWTPQRSRMVTCSLHQQTATSSSHTLNRCGLRNRHEGGLRTARATDSCASSTLRRVVTEASRCIVSGLANPGIAFRVFFLVRTRKC